MAEYDRAFIERMMEMGDEALAVHLHSLSPDERKALEAALFPALSQRVVIEHIGALQTGLIG